VSLGKSGFAAIVMKKETIDKKVVAFLKM